MSSYRADDLTGFEARTTSLPREDDGELVATLVRPISERKRVGPAVLYVHGYCDYFFQSFVSDAFVAAGFSFYALDLRRHGRSLRPGNRQNFMKSIDEWFAEMTWALEAIRDEQGGPVLVLAHSTGCLLATLYAKRGPRRDLIQGLILNSPFLEFAVGPLARAGLPALSELGKRVPRLRLPVALGHTYGRTLHRSEGGEWDYDLEKKPLSGFPIWAGWMRAIALAQTEARAGLNLGQPILLMHSARSYPPGGPLCLEAGRADAVLNVEHMREYGPGLGSHVELVAFEGGKHDLFLSAKEVRSAVMETAVRFAQGVVDGA
jgi:alpha-beta hydrolase superfamily lysophospholipase